MPETSHLEPDRRDRQLQQYRFLESLQAALTGPRDLAGLYSAVVHRIAAAFPSEAVCVATYDDVSHTVSVVHGAGKRTDWDLSLFLNTVETQRAVVRDKVLVVPIVHAERGGIPHCWGVIGIERLLAAGDVFTSGDRYTLRVAAERLAVELHHRRHVLLDDVIDGLLKKSKPIDVYTHALRELRRFIRYDHSASVMTIQRGMAQLTVRAEKLLFARGNKESLGDSPRRGKAVRLTPAQTRFLSRLDSPVQLRREGERYHLVGKRDADAAGLWRVFCLSGRVEGAILCYPLIFGSQVLGVLRIAANRAEAFHSLDNHTRVLDRFARLLSVTLFRSEMYQQSDHQLQAIKQIGRAITEPLPVDDVCRQVLQLALRVLRVEVGAVGLVNESGELALRAYQGTTLAEVPVLTMEDGIGGAVVRSGQTRAVSDVMREANYVLFNGRVRSELVAPIIYNREVIGFLDVESFEEGRFREEDEEAISFLEALANQAAIAIKSAQLQDAARQRLGAAVAIDPTLSMLGLHDLLVEELRDKIHQLAGANDRLAAANQAKSEFLAHMSHDLRGPLNVIVGLSSLLVDPIVASGLADDKRRESLELIRSNGERLSSLIGNILDISALESGRVELDVAPFHAMATFEYLTAMARTIAAESNKQLDISIRVDSGIAMICADEDKFSRIIQNLLFNAIKFTPSGGSITLVARADSGDGPPANVRESDLYVTVSDTGVGIAAGDQARIFQPFQQVESSEAREYHGTGLGLTVVRQLVELHGGRVWLQSTPEVGSSFHFVLPGALLPSDVEAEVVVERVTTSTPALTRARPTILVVEDIPAHMSVMRLAVTSRGYQMHGASTGAEALAWLKSHRPDLIVLDMQLPDGDGFTLAAQLRSRVETHAVPIIAVSADALSVNEDRARASGCDAFLTKPIEIAQLLTTIEAVLR